MENPAADLIKPKDIRRNIPNSLEEIVMRTLAKNALYRFQNAREFLDALINAGSFYDWSATARRPFAGISMSATLLASVIGGQRLLPDLTGLHHSKSPLLTKAVDTITAKASLTN